MGFDLSQVKFSGADLKKGLAIPKTITPELAEETGLHIGDGNMNYYLNKGERRGFYQLRGHIADDHAHYEERVKKLYENLYNIKVKLRDMRSTGVCGFQIWSEALVTFKNKVLGLPLGKKLDIKIPYFFTKKEDLIRSVVKGIFDTDGTLYLEPKNRKLYPRIEIKTISKILAYQLHKLLLKLGFKATKRMQIRIGANLNNVYEVSVRGEKMLYKWIYMIQSANPKHTAKFNFYMDNS